MNELQVFENGGWSVRSIERDGEPWFVASDVCKALEISNNRDALSRLDADEKDVVSTDTLGGNQLVSIVSEAGLYSLIGSSRKPEAKEFKRWVNHEVLPAIRKTGQYGAPTGQKLLALAVLEAQKMLDVQAKQIEEMKPKADFYDAVAGSKDAVEMGLVAKTLGVNNLFQFLRDQKILMENNIPYQAFVDAKCFRVVEQKFSKPDGSISVSFKTLVYQKGLELIRRTIAKNGLVKVSK